MANEVKIKVTLDDNGAVTKVEKLERAFDDLGAAESKVDGKKTREIGESSKSSVPMVGSLQVAFGNLASHGIEMCISAVKDFAADIVNVGSGFETSMSKVSALSGATGDELDALSAKARELGAATTFSASDAADALGYMSLAGWDTQEMLAGVGSVLTLAQAGEMDLAAASDLVTDYLSAFNMTADETTRMVDVLAYAQANANTSVEGLGMAFKNCSANCNAAGMDVETTSAAISMMANQGLKGSEAGSALNAVMRDMTAKMQDGAIAIGDQAIAVMDAQGNYRDFVDILGDVEAATNGMGQAEKASALQATFTADSIKGLNLMLNAGAGEMDSFREELYNCAGTGQEMADVMTDNLGGDMAAMGSALDELKLKIYDGLQEPLRGLVQFFTTYVVPVFSVLIDVVSTAFSVIGTVIGTAVSVIQAILTPAIEWIQANIVAPIQELMASLQERFGAMWESMQARLQAAWEVMQPIVEAGMSVIQGVFDVVLPMIQGVWDTVWGAIGTYVTGIFNNIQITIETVMSVIEGIIQTVTAIMSGDWEGALEGMRSIATAIFDGIRSFISNAVNTVASIVTGVFNGLKSTVGSIFNAIKDAITKPIETAKNTIKGIVDAIGGFFSNFKIELPHIKLPHFGIQPEGWQIGDLLKGSIPSLGIEWYATGGEFNSARVIGIGEAGRETVLPLTNRTAMRHVGEAITEAGGMGDANLAREIRALRRDLEAYAQAPFVLALNNREFARAMRDSEGYL